VKVNSFREIFRFTPSLKPQSEGEGYGQNSYSSDGHSGRKDPSNSDAHPDPGTPPTQPTEAEQLLAVQAALEEFSRDAATQNHGIQASLRPSSPTQPGLSVVLSDINGNVIRSFTGSEFVKLRKAGGQDTRGRGKLLDQKY
jgi:hypothetical protein